MADAKFFQIKVPPGVQAKQQLQVTAPNGVNLIFSVPENCPPGTLLRVPMPAKPNPQQQQPPPATQPNPAANIPPQQQQQQPPPQDPAAANQPPLPSNPPPPVAAADEGKEKAEVTQYVSMALSELGQRLGMKKEELKKDLDELETKIAKAKEELKGYEDEHAKKKGEMDEILESLPKLEVRT